MHDGVDELGQEFPGKKSVYMFSFLGMQLIRAQSYHLNAGAVQKGNSQQIVPSKS